MLTKDIEPLDGGRRFAIGDVHGSLQTLIKLLKKIRLNKSDALFLVGDYIDRGPDSKGVLDLLMSLQRKGYRVQPLMGNHELMFLMAYNDPTYNRTWRKEYGAETLKSFDVVDIRDIDPVYVHWFLNLPKIVISGNHVISHAGVNFISKNWKKDTPENRISTLFRNDAVPDKSGKYRAIVGHKSKGI